jgi:hypothetical protein
MQDEKVFANTPTNNKGNKIFYTLFAQHVSTLTWVHFRCSFTENSSNADERTRLDWHCRSVGWNVFIKWNNLFT